MFPARSLVVAACALACAAFALPATAAVRGLDVSHYNGPIDWQPVADAGYQFAFAEATKGNDGIDVRYEQNRDDAAAVGIWLGAYHFARPGGRTPAAQARDAISEARHFVAFAQPAADDLVPVLDLERSDGLSPAALAFWASTWLRETERLVGARPAVYASVAFWRHSLGNTSSFARNGYSLWLARWTHAQQPELPAAGWAGIGWTFWQWTDCGRVTGLHGCVDLDRFRGDDVTPYLIGSAPNSLVDPELTGATAVGQPLTAGEGGWTGAEPLSLSYAWQRCNAAGASCRLLPGATEATYVPTTTDVGSTLVATVTASNRAGSAQASSLPSAPVAP